MIWFVSYMYQCKNYMKIRPENKDDHDAISETTITAFEDHPFSQQTEHLIIDELRRANALPVSLVAVINEQVIGHSVPG